MCLCPSPPVDHALSVPPPPCLFPAGCFLPGPLNTIPARRVFIHLTPLLRVLLLLGTGPRLFMGPTKSLPDVSPARPQPHVLPQATLAPSHLSSWEVPEAWLELGPPVHTLLAHIISAGERHCSPPKIRNKTGCQLPPLLFTIVLEALARAISQEK